MIENEEIIEESRPLTDYEQAMQEATFADSLTIQAVEESISQDVLALFDEIDTFIEQNDTEVHSTQVLEEDTPPTSSNNNLQVVEEPTVELTREEQAALDQAIATLDNEIPVNSASLLVEDVTSRFSSAIWYEAIKEKQIILAGLGGIGSYVAFLLARLQPARIRLFDDDRVEAANMSGQLYSATQLGQYKAGAIYDTMKNFGNYYGCNVSTTRFNENTPATPIMICGFDNMAARSVFYNRWKRHLSGLNDRSKCLLIDGRLAAEEFQVFAIKGDDERAMKLYEEEWLFEDTDAEETICSYKQTTFMANMIGSVMVNLFINFVANECDPVFPRDVPFLTTYDASRMYFKVEM